LWITVFFIFSRHLFELTVRRTFSVYLVVAAIELSWLMLTCVGIPAR